MGKQKSDDKKKKKKSSQLVIRIDAGERDAFVKLCDALDTSAAREIRRFMRDWVAAHAPKSDTVEAPEDAAAVADPAPVTPQPDAEKDERPASKSRRKRPVEATA